MLIYAHTRSSRNTRLPPCSHTRYKTNTPPSPFSLPPPIPLSGRSFLSPSLLLKHLFFLPFLSHFHTLTHSHQLSAHQPHSMPSSDEKEKRVHARLGGSVCLELELEEFTECRIEDKRAVHWTFSVAEIPV